MLVLVVTRFAQLAWSLSELDSEVRLEAKIDTFNEKFDNYQKSTQQAIRGVFVCGEMLDWEAPTGGYLLTASWATGRWAGKAAAGPII